MRTIAKEVLIFFTAIGLLLIILGVLLLRNAYYKQRVNFLTGNESRLKMRLDSLPMNNIDSLYKKISNDLVENYQAGNKVFAIPKLSEQQFLSENSRDKVNVQHLPIHRDGYFDYVFRNGFTTIAFDYVSEDQFRDFLRNKNYRDKLFFIYSGNLGQRKIEGLPVIKKDNPKPEFDWFAPSNTLIEIGTRDEFEEYILTGLRFDRKTTPQQKSQLLKDILKTSEAINSAKDSILEDNIVTNLMIKIAIVLAIILYPLRLSIYLIRWSIKTIQAKK